VTTVGVEPTLPLREKDLESSAFTAPPCCRDTIEVFHPIVSIVAPTGVEPAPSLRGVDLKSTVFTAPPQCCNTYNVISTVCIDLSY
jgi:hypothetical protein